MKIERADVITSSMEKNSYLKKDFEITPVLVHQPTSVNSTRQYSHHTPTQAERCPRVGTQAINIRRNRNTSLDIDLLFQIVYFSTVFQIGALLMRIRQSYILKGLREIFLCMCVQNILAR